MAVKPEKVESADKKVEMEGAGPGTGSVGSTATSPLQTRNQDSRTSRPGSELKNWADLMNSLSPKQKHGDEETFPEITKADDDAFLDDLPLGSEANTLTPVTTPHSKIPTAPQDPRISGLKCTGRLGWTSFNSELSNQTSGSSANELDILLSQRGVDPEQMLRSLGFGFVREEEPAMLRVPVRFMQRSHAQGIEIEEFLEEYPELQHMLKKSPVAAGWRNLSKSLSAVGTMKSVLGRLGQSSKPSSTVAAPVEAEPLQLPKPQSILIPENREALARQGYYDDYAAKSEKNGAKATEITAKKPSMETAAKRRQQFQKTRSTKRWSMVDSDELGADEVEDPWISKSLDESRTRLSGTDFSSSMDSSDSPVTDSRGSSLSEKRRIYEEEFQRSAEMFFQGSLTKQREDMVSHLIDQYEQEGNYTASPKTSKQNTVEKSPTFIEGEGADDDNHVRIVVSDTDPLSKTMSEKIPAPPSHSAQTYLNIVSAQIERLSDSGSDHTLVGSPRPSEGEFAHPVLLQRISKDSVFESEADLVDGQISVTCQTSLDSQKLDENDNVSLTKGSTTRKRRGSEEDLPRMASVQSDSSGFGEADIPAELPGPEHDRLMVLSLGSSSESAGTLASSNTTVPLPRTVTDSSTQTTSVEHIPHTHKTISEIYVSGVQREKKVELTAKPQTGRETSRFVSSVYIPPVKKTPTSTIVKQNSGATISGQGLVLGRTRVSVTVPNKSQNSSEILAQREPEKSKITSVWRRNGGKPPSLGSPRAPLAQPEEFDSDEADGNKCYLADQRPPLYSASSFDDRPVSEVSILNLNVAKKEFGSRISLADDSDYSYSSAADSTASCSTSEIMDYRKLVRLVNQPVSYRGRKRSIFRYRPKKQIRDWPNLLRKKRLQEETRLLQHALQKYKTELHTLETSCLLQYQQTYEDISDEEREEVEELQTLWGEIHSQVQGIEQHLANRMKAITKGNDFFSILSSLNVIHSMCELLKEQMYHETVSSGLELEDAEQGEEDDLDFPANTSFAHSTPSPGRLVHTSGYGSPFGTPSEMRHHYDVHHSMEEMRHSIFEEIKHELNRSTQQLHVEMQEIQRQNLELRIKSARSPRKSKSVYRSPNPKSSRQTDV